MGDEQIAVVVENGQKGLQLPEGWATDGEGHPTIDPREAIEGLLLPIGGYKGTGIALVMGLLSTLLSEASFGSELGNMVDGPKPGADGHFFLAINVAGFTDVDRFKQRMDGIIHQLRGSRRRADCPRILMPGEREHELQRLYLAQGIPLNQETLESLRQTAAELGVDGSALDS